jgi:hypothetical protein
MGKRVFQILDELNVRDGNKNKDYAVVLGNQVLQADYKIKKGGTEITVGIAGNHVSDLITGEKFAVILVVDKKQYDELANESHDNGNGEHQQDF